MSLKNKSWPPLPLAEWKDTYDTLHMWTQIVGKIRLALAPLENHWWNTTLYVNSRGLTTSAMSYNDMLFQIDFDFVNHLLLIQTTKGSTRTITLKPRSVADFYQEIMSVLADLEIYIPLWTIPVEVQDPTPFEEDYKHESYNPEYIQRLWRILSQASRVFTEFRSHFIGKVSPVHFFWELLIWQSPAFLDGTAPIHPGAPNMARFVAIEAYSHEVSSCGFWPGGGPVDEPVFYAYAYPEPTGFKEYPIQPPEAFYNTDMSEFILPYEVVRSSKSPDDTLMTFLKVHIKRLRPLQNGIGIHWSVSSSNYRQQL